jgi:hypothetical protein
MALLQQSHMCISQTVRSCSRMEARRGSTSRLTSDAQGSSRLTQFRDNLDIRLENNEYRAVSSGRALPSHYSEPKGWGPLRLCLFFICIMQCTSVDSDSHRNSCRSRSMTISVFLSGKEAFQKSCPLMVCYKATSQPNHAHNTLQPILVHPCIAPLHCCLTPLGAGLHCCFQQQE